MRKVLRVTPIKKSRLWVRLSQVVSKWRVLRLFSFLWRFSKKLFTDELASPTFKILTIVQFYRFFVILTSGPYQDLYNARSDFVEATDFVDIWWRDLGRFTCRSTNLHSPFEMCNLLTVTIIWREKFDLLAFWKNSTHDTTQYAFSTWQESALKSFARYFVQRNDVFTTIWIKTVEKFVLGQSRAWKVVNRNVFLRTGFIFTCSKLRVLQISFYYHKPHA